MSESLLMFSDLCSSWVAQRVRTAASDRRIFPCIIRRLTTFAEELRRTNGCFLSADFVKRLTAFTGELCQTDKCLLSVGSVRCSTAFAGQLRRTHKCSLNFGSGRSCRKTMRRFAQLLVLLQPCQLLLGSSWEAEHSRQVGRAHLCVFLYLFVLFYHFNFLCSCLFACLRSPASFSDLLVMRAEQSSQVGRARLCVSPSCASFSAVCFFSMCLAV